MSTNINKATMYDKVRNLMEAVDKLPWTDDYGWGWFKDADESYCYVEFKGDCYRIPYTMSETGEVELGESKQKVIQETTFTVIEDSEEELEKSFTDKLISTLDKYFGGSKVNKGNGLQFIKQFEEDQMIAIEPMYIPPGAVDGHGDTMTHEEIIKMVDNFNHNLAAGNIGTKESHTRDVDYFTIEKAWVNPEKCYLGENYIPIPEGQPIIKIQFNDRAKWEERKSGELCGVSIGASALKTYEVDVNE